MATATVRSRQSNRWCDGDPRPLTQECSDVLRDGRGAQAAAAENNRGAVKLLELAATRNSGRHSPAGLR